jgi:hypothetical protein
VRSGALPHPWGKMRSSILAFLLVLGSPVVTSARLTNVSAFLDAASSGSVQSVAPDSSPDGGVGSGAGRAGARNTVADVGSAVSGVGGAGESTGSAGAGVGAGLGNVRAAGGIGDGAGAGMDGAISGLSNVSA